VPKNCYTPPGSTSFYLRGPEKIAVTWWGMMKALFSHLRRHYDFLSAVICWTCFFMQLFNGYRGEILEGGV
jgi:hypothetical protein